MPTSRNPRSHPITLAGLLALAALGLGLAGLDWAMRFHWFQWHRTFMVSTYKPRYIGDWPPVTEVAFPPTRGGDLSRLLGVPEAIAQFGVDRPDSGGVQTDEFGFPNIPPTTNRSYDIALVGDSFLLQGRSSSNLLGARLERLLGTSVYTIAHAGRGSSFAFSGFLDHPNFRRAPPRVMVWCIAERDATGFFFDSVAVQAMKRVAQPSYVLHADAPRRHDWDWQQFAPSRLRSALPNTSILAQGARRVWTWLRFQVFRRLNENIVISTQPVAGHWMLFYSENLKSLCWPPEIRDVPRIKRAAFYVNRDYFQARGIQWVVVLIPEKEQVYRDWVPPSRWTGGQPLPPSSLHVIEESLRSVGVTVVNLLPVFQRAVGEGELLYWPDDTHWNARGMERAAAEIAKVLQSLAPAH